MVGRHAFRLGIQRRKLTRQGYIRPQNKELKTNYYAKYLANYFENAGWPRHKDDQAAWRLGQKSSPRNCGQVSPGRHLTMTTWDNVIWPGLVKWHFGQKTRSRPVFAVALQHAADNAYINELNDVGITDRVLFILHSIRAISFTGMSVVSSEESCWFHIEYYTMPWNQVI
jgi:hypothetical protein